MHQPRSHIPAPRVVALVLACATTATAQPDTAFASHRARVLAELRATAAALPFIVPGELCYGRTDSWPAPRAALAAHRQAIEATRPAAHDLAGLVPLLDDDDPKVRLMAAYGLFRSCQPASLPILAEHVDDTGAIPALMPASLAMQMAEARRRELPPLHSTTVGAEIRSFLAAWGGPKPGSEAFATWSARQLELAPTAAELRLRMLLVTGGASPIDAPPHELLEVRGHAARAPRGAREIAQIALFHDKTANVFARYPTVERDLQFAARRLGRDNLLRLLRDEAPLFDGQPLPPEQLVGFVEAVQRFVLARPLRVGLEPEDADALIEIGTTTDRHAMFRAAARLRPDRATEILRTALTRTDNPLAAGERVDCAILLWDLRGDENREYLARWFYEHVEPIHFIPEARHRFILHLLSRFGADDRALFATLVKDPRFDRIGPDALLAIVHTLNLTRMEPVVPQRLMMNFMHPLGLDRAFRDLDAANNAWPGETQVMLARMAGWRQRIRAHVAPWVRDD